MLSLPIVLCNHYNAHCSLLTFNTKARSPLTFSLGRPSSSATLPSILKLSNSNLKMQGGGSAHLHGDPLPTLATGATQADKKGHREASLLRYKEKRQNRLFAKRVRYEVRKLNAEKRPRLKGRFVKRD
ncbi:hypothetical protein SLEP1_g45213 [Rubroshorea leprosula]|uniref:CCT domain-containing protein n=1 Tax=Rubroshorea leprosula TaxID=152421 RepID=A0AAV5LKW7_9ROSI|nr:hypothetical protein SLEP1_g45213 [Rubroshorea leprosula]